MYSIVIALLFLIKLVKLPTNFIEHLRSRYEQQGVKLYRKLEEYEKKVCKVRLDIKFLENCKVHNVLPKFLRFRLYKKSLQHASFYTSWQHKLLINEIRCKRRTLRTLSVALTNLHGEAQRYFSQLYYLVLKRRLKQIIVPFELKISTTHEKKLDNLGIDAKLAPCDPNKIIHNYSSVTLPPRVKYLLAFGLDFCLPVYNINFYNYYLSFEKLANYIKNTQCNNKQNLISELRTMAHRYYYNFKPYKVFSSIFSRGDISCLKQFSSDKSIVVSKPDKGKGIVITNKVDYINSMLTIISDSTKFSLIDESIEKYTLRIEDKINSFIRKLKNTRLIAQDVYDRTFVSGSGPGILYGLPKIHKIDFASKFQFRPIFAAYKTPSYNLAKYLVPLLSHLTTNDYTCSNSYQFVNDIKKFRINSECVLASFDIESLYTNIPLSETIDICLSKLYNSPTATFIGLSRDSFKTLLELSVKYCFFMFNNRFYQQLDGLGMGLPLSPTFANIFMGHHETNWLSNCPSTFKPIFYRRYVDDTFLIFKHKSHVMPFLDFLNSQHSNIKFTCEIEKNKTLPFLDCLVRRGGTDLSCSVYRKQCFSGLGTSFYSFCSFQFRLNSVKTLLARAFGICSDYFSLHNEFEFLKEYFLSNGYCTNFIYKQINKFMSSKYVSASQSSSSTIKFYLSLPYFGKQSENLRRDLCILLKKYFADRDFRIILCNNFKISSFFGYKDKLSPGMQSSLIYKFGCVQCTSTYIGMTNRRLLMRVAEHAGRSFRTGNVLSQPAHSAVRCHAQCCGCPVTIDNFNIIDHSSNSFDLRILESLHIFKQKPKLNNSLSSFPLSIIGS